MVLRPPCVLGGAAARGGLIVKVTGNSLKHGNRVSLKKKKKSRAPTRKSLRVIPRPDKGAARAQGSV